MQESNDKRFGKFSAGNNLFGNNMLLFAAVLMIGLFLMTGPVYAWGSWQVQPENNCKIWVFQPEKIRTFTWTGGCKDGYVNGVGTLQWLESGEVVNQYVGEYLLGRAHGKGVFQEYGPTTRYEGNFVNGRRSGKGVQIFANGSRYSGEWRYDRPNGKGVKTWSKGASYNGDFVDGEMQGDGVLTLRSGRVFRGKWENGSYLEQ